MRRFMESLRTGSIGVDLLQLMNELSHDCFRADIEKDRVVAQERDKIETVGK